MSATERGRQDGADFVTVGEVDLCYDTFGDPARHPMLLIMGLGFQLVHWLPGGAPVSPAPGPGTSCGASPPRPSGWCGSTTSPRAAQRTCRDAATASRTWR